MVVCKFFAQGHCRYGNVCFNEHVHPGQSSSTTAGFGGGGNRFQALAGHEGGSKEAAAAAAAAAASNPYLSAANAPSIVDEICKEMDVWEQSGMWPFSCFGFSKEVTCIPGFEDISPDEMRLRAYEEKDKGNIAPYESFWRTKLGETKNKFQMLKRPTQAIKSQMIDHVRQIQSEALKAITSPASSNFTKNVFGAPVSPSTNPFGTVTSSSTSVFGTPPSSTSIFGAAAATSANNVSTNNTFGASSGFGGSGGAITSSIFGAATSNSVFGAAAMGTATTSVFGGSAAAPATMTTPSIFGTPQVSTAGTTTSMFGAPAVFGAPTTAPVFGAAAAGAATTPSTGSLFASPSTVSNVFGAPQVAAPVITTPTAASTINSLGFVMPPAAVAPASLSSVFGSAVATPASNLFDSQPPTQPSITAPSPLISKTLSASSFPLLDALDEFLPPPTTFSSIETFSAEEISQFQADEFLDMTKIPLRPPPREFV